MLAHNQIASRETHSSGWQQVSLPSAPIDWKFGVMRRWISLYHPPRRLEVMRLVPGLTSKKGQTQNSKEGEKQKILNKTDTNLSIWRKSGYCVCGQGRHDNAMMRIHSPTQSFSRLGRGALTLSSRHSLFPASSSSSLLDLALPPHFDLAVILVKYLLAFSSHRTKLVRKKKLLTKAPPPQNQLFLSWRWCI